MKKLSIFISGMGMAIAALSCAAADYQENNEPVQAGPPLTSAPRDASNANVTAPSDAGPKAAVAPDNTEINRRDNATGALTSQDQTNKREDLTITSTIRKSIMASDMSTLAKNVKIISINGVVTLRGPVDTAAEKETIGQLAGAAAGVQKVDNLLDVKGVSTSHSSTN